MKINQKERDREAETILQIADVKMTANFKLVLVKLRLKALEERAFNL